MTTSIRFISIAFVIIFASNEFSFGQGSKTIQWQYQVEVAGENEVLLKFTANIAHGWHLYSQHMKEGGPMPTRFSFTPSDGYRLLGQTDEKGNAVKFYDDTYEMEITWYTGVVSFAQRVRRTPQTTYAKGIIEFMTCNDYTCIPGKQEFNIDLRPGKKT